MTAPSDESLRVRGCCAECYGDDEEGCIAGDWYGMCSSPDCYGLCEYEGRCGCGCHLGREGGVATGG
jgi:hypothetical protein